MQGGRRVHPPVFTTEPEKRAGSMLDRAFGIATLVNIVLSSLRHQQPAKNLVPSHF
jgi:hypothetical protein